MIPRRLVILCACLTIGICAVAAPPALADNGVAGWVAGKLVSGVGSGAGEAVVGNLMARAGLDPTTNALGEIFSQLTKLSNQISSLQDTSDKTLQQVLSTSFDVRVDQLDITTITKLQSDYACYLDASRSRTYRDDCRARVKASNEMPSRSASAAI